MMAQGLYKEKLLEHYKHPRNRCDGPIQGADAIERGSNPRCGDEVEVGIFLNDGRLDKLQFRGRGCAVCIASASMMTEAVAGMGVRQALLLCDEMHVWFGDLDHACISGLPESLQPLAALREHPARQKCVLLSWEALAQAISGTTDR